MKKNFNFKILYFISMIIATYFTYLFYKQFSLEIKAILIIGIILASLFFLLTKNFIENNKDFKLCKGKTLWIVIISSVLSIMLIKIAFSFFTIGYKSIHLFCIHTICSFICIYYICSLTCIYFINNKNKRNLILICIFCLIFGTYYFFYTDINVLHGDSSSYIDYDFSRLFSLKFNDRTPIYPIIIDINRKLFGRNFLTFVCIFQYVIWFISIIFLYKTLCLLIKNDKLNAVFTILYAISPSIVLWNNMIMTESIALSGTLIFIYLIIKYIKSNKCSYAYYCIFLTIVLTFHRPTAIIYLLGLFIFFIFRMVFEKRNIKNDIRCFIISCISVIIIVIYAVLYHKEYGVYSISDVTVRQDLIVSIEQKYYKSSNNIGFVEYVDEQLAIGDGIWPEVMRILSKYGNTEIQKITNYCRMKNIIPYLHYILDLAKDHSSVTFTTYYVEKNNWLINGMNISLVNITFFHVYIITMIEFILTIFKWIKNKTIPWINVGLFAFPFIIVLSSFIGTCGEFMRTAVCCVLFTFISIAIFIGNGIKIYNK